MNPPVYCQKWCIWSYKLPLRKPLAVLGGDGVWRKGWIVGRFNHVRSQWEYGEVAPLPSFHQISMTDVYTDLISVFKHDQPAKTALVQTLFDVWDTPKHTCDIKINSLLGSSQDSTNGQQTTVKIKLGRQSLNDDINWFSKLTSEHPSVTWRLDCNRQWSLEQLRHFWSCCNTDRVEYIEDPLQDPRLIEQVPEIPIALDESLSDHSAMLDLPNVVAAIIKPTLHLGWQQLLHDHPSVKGVISSTFEGSLGLWGLGQLAQSHIDNGIHGLGTLNWFAEEVVEPPLTYTDRILRLNIKPPTPIFSKLQWEDGL